VIFKQHPKDGSADIEFTLKERYIIFFKGHLHLPAIFLKHFGNNLIRIVSEWQMLFNDDVKKMLSFSSDVNKEAERDIANNK
jgi:hypothetical protein